MTNTAHYDYFSYLTKRSPLGFIYRRCYLYPRLNRHLNGKVLDIGCGIGDFLGSRKNATGIDINNYNVEYCQKKGYTAKLITGNQFPFKDQSFEGAILDNVLEHLEDPENTLSEIQRVVKPNGSLIVGVPGKKGYQEDDDHKIFYDAEKLNATLKKFGFESTKHIYAPFKSEYLNENKGMYCLYGVFKKSL